MKQKKAGNLSEIDYQAYALWEVTAPDLVKFEDVRKFFRNAKEWEIATGINEDLVKIISGNLKPGEYIGLTTRSPMAHFYDGGMYRAKTGPDSMIEMKKRADGTRVLLNESGDTVISDVDLSFAADKDGLNMTESALGKRRDMINDEYGYKILLHDDNFMGEVHIEADIRKAALRVASEPCDVLVLDANGFCEIIKYEDISKYVKRKP